MRKVDNLRVLLGIFLMPFSAVFLAVAYSSDGSLIEAPLAITLLLIANVLILSRDASNNIVFIILQATQMDCPHAA